MQTSDDGRPLHQSRQLSFVRHLEEQNGRETQLIFCNVGTQLLVAPDLPDASESTHHRKDSRCYVGKTGCIEELRKRLWRFFMNQSG